MYLCAVTSLAISEVVKGVKGWANTDENGVMMEEGPERSEERHNALNSVHRWVAPRWADFAFSMICLPLLTSSSILGVVYNIGQHRET